MTSSPAAANDARIAALSGLFDYAGLFWPAELSLADAVAEYLAARQGPHGWLLRRFVVPADQLAALAATLAGNGGSAPAGPAPTATDPAAFGPVPVSVLVGPLSGIDAALPALAAAVADAGRLLDVEAVELVLPPPPVPAEAGASPLGRAAVALRAATGARMVAAEIPLAAGRPEATRAAMGAVRAGRVAFGSDAVCAPGAAPTDGVITKVRCGGPTAAHFPAAADLAYLLDRSAAWRLPVKVTAGLHHPLARADRTGALMHGFLNLLAAAALATSRDAAATVIEDVLTEQDPGALRLTASGLCWRGAMLDAADVTAARAVLTCVGSCSIAGPVAELTESAALPVPNRR